MAALGVNGLVKFIIFLLHYFLGQKCVLYVSFIQGVVQYIRLLGHGG